MPLPGLMPRDTHAVAVFSTSSVVQIRAWCQAGTQRGVLEVALLRTPKPLPNPTQDMLLVHLAPTQHTSSDPRVACSSAACLHLLFRSMVASRPLWMSLEQSPPPPMMDSDSVEAALMRFRRTVSRSGHLQELRWKR